MSNKSLKLTARLHQLNFGWLTAREIEDSDPELANLLTDAFYVAKQTANGLKLHPKFVAEHIQEEKLSPELLSSSWSSGWRTNRTQSPQTSNNVMHPTANSAAFIR